MVGFADVGKLRAGVRAWDGAPKLTEWDAHKLRLPDDRPNQVIAHHSNGYPQLESS